MLLTDIETLISICEQKPESDKTAGKNLGKIALMTAGIGGLSAAGTALAAKFGAFGPAGENYMNTLPAHMWDTAKSTVRGAWDAYDDAKSRHFIELVKMNHPKVYRT